MIQNETERGKKSLSKKIDKFWFVAVALQLGIGDTLLFVSLEDTLFLVYLAVSPCTCP